MGFKTITVTEEAYRKLARAKGPQESFTDVINRVFGGPSALELSGVLGTETGPKVAREVRRIRKDLDERVRKTAKAMGP